jgi:two-component sensor histidine kinase
MVTFTEITERKRGEQERELLSRELSHRVRNILAVVQALAMQTEASGSIEEYRDAFVGRLSAMTRAHSMLLDEQWRGADLKALVELALQPYRVDAPGAIEVEGPSLRLTAHQGLGLSLILHELGTNDAKYGALSREGARVHVSWRVESGDRGRHVSLRWRERGGPRVKPPREKSFGTRLIEQASAYELEGDLELNYAAGGLRCEVVFPLT